MAAERALAMMGRDGANIATAASRDSSTIATLVVRLYEQTRNDEIKTRCLNLIDQMEEWGYYGVAGELSKLDR